MRCRLTKYKKILIFLLIAAQLAIVALHSNKKYNIRERKFVATHSHTTNVPERKLNFKSFDPGIVVYNRVPKCASTTTRILLSRLQKFSHGRYDLRVENYPRIKQILDDAEQKALADKWTSVDSPTLFIRHLQFLDFEKYGYQQPVYVNILRDPIEQFISGYYFMRFGFEGWSEEKIRKWLGVKTKEERFMSIEDCIARNATECVRRNPSKLLGYFCGHKKGCRKDSSWSLEEAKKNVMKHFAVVGIVEDYQNSLKVLEATLPRYFRNITSVYEEMQRKGDYPRTRTARKVNPPNHVKDKLRKELHFQVDFYEFVKARFHKQLRMLQSQIT